MNLSEDILENPMSNITYQNYEDGLIKGYRLGFQDSGWYEQNKNNFCNSVRQYWPDLLPSYVKDDIKRGYKIPNNYFGFYPDEIIRYGKLDKIKVSIDDKKAIFWAIKIPSGLQIYHTSRGLGLNHSDFPIKGYNNNLDSNENKENILKTCPPKDFIGHSISDIKNKNVCTYVSYYSNPYITEKYLNTESYRKDQIKYAYGVSEYTKNKKYNDRLKTQSDEYFQGVQSYVLQQDTYFIIVALDDFLIERPDLGRTNMNVFSNVMKYLYQPIKNSMNVTNIEMNNFIDLIKSVTGIGTLADNVRIIKRDYPKAKNFDIKVWNWLETNVNVYLNSNTKTNTAGYIKTVSETFNQQPNDIMIELEKYKGVRFSTHEHDRPVMNMLGWLFSGIYPVSRLDNNQPITVYGFASSSIYFYSKGTSIIKPKPYVRLGYQYYIPNGVFHSELGMFYAPDVFKRNRDNKFDLEYSINYEGISQELRKYKTTNIMKYKNNNVTGFHQGHLMEHSTWVGIISSNIIKNKPFTQYINRIDVTKDVYLIAGYFHDIGKSGDCSKIAVYKGLNPTDPTMSICNYVRDEENNQIIGMKYYDIPDHPEKGYEYFKGYRVYKKYTLENVSDIEEYNKNAILTYLDDWNKMFDKLDLDEYSKKMIRIAVGAHWAFGNTVKKIILTNNKLEQNEIVEDFITDIELFYNDEFYNLDTNVFFSVILFVIIISVSDIIGSEYNPSQTSTGLTSDQKATLINYLPNISLDNIDMSDQKPIVDQIIDYALNLQSDAKFKQNIFSNVRNNVEVIIKAVYEILNTDYVFKEGNNYSLLYNLIKSYPKISDIKRAYKSKFPKVIAFDLDQTLFSVTFHQNKKSTYNIYSETYNVIKEVQLVRKKYFPTDPTYIAITSRHYSPKSLLDLIQSKTYKNQPNPLYYENFDYIISRYTGSDEKISNAVSRYNNFFQQNGYPSDGFVLDTNTKELTKIKSDNVDFMDLMTESKHGHFNLLKTRYNINYNDILTFDDDEKYYTEDGLGPAKDIYVAGVLNTKQNQGIKEALFKMGVSYFVFDKIVES